MTADVPTLTARIRELEQQVEDEKHERRIDREAFDVVQRSKSPCGHWGGFAVTDDGGKHITCMQCDREAAEQRVREMEPYLRHKDGCAAVQTKCAAVPKKWSAPPCDCGLAAIHPIQKGSER